MKYCILCAAAVVAVACSTGKDQGGATSEANGSTTTAASSTSAPKGTASISGTVKFTGTAPANPAIDMSEEPACKTKYTSTPTDPEYVIKDGKVGNVFVYVKGGLPAGASYPAPAEPVKIDQQGCLYHPRVMGVMVGQKVEIDNSDPVLHNIKAVPTKNRPFNVSQPTAGMKTTRTFTSPEVMVPLQCNVHSWMHAYAGVTSHPFFATTKDDGSFEISGLPAGTYEIEAWHEKLGTQTMTVTVGDGEKKTADFTYAPRA